MATVLVGKTPFKSQLPGSDLEVFAAARTASMKLFLAHAAAVISGDKMQAEALQHTIVTSAQVRLHAMLRAAKKLPFDRRPALEVLLEKAPLLTFEMPLSEPVPVYALTKKSGGKRIIHKPPLLRRAQYEIVCDLLRPHVKPRAFQYTDRGVHKAIAAAKQSMGLGFIHAARLDIRDFFQSFEPEALVKELPLRKEVVEQAVVARHYKVMLEKNKATVNTPGAISMQHDHLTQARLGLPQGASCSPMVAVFCISHLGWSNLPGVRMLNWADDFLLLAKTEGELEVAIGKLTSAMGKLPGGTFQFKKAVCGDGHAGFEFLNHRLVLQGAVARALLTERAICRLYERINALDRQLNKLGFLLHPTGKAKVGDILARQLAYAQGWATAFSECDDAMDWLKSTIASVKSDAAWAGLSLAQLKSMADDSMAYDQHSYGTFA